MTTNCPETRTEVAPGPRETVGGRIRRARTDRGLSQAAVGGERFSASYISLVESGRREPTPEALEVIALALGTTVELLVHGERSRAEVEASAAMRAADGDLAAGRWHEAQRRLGATDTVRLSGRTRRAVLTRLADAHERLGEHEAAVETLRAVVADARRDGDLLGAVAPTMALVSLQVDLGDLLQASALGAGMLAEIESGGLAGTEEHLRLGATVLWVYTERGDLLYAGHRATTLIRQAEAAGSTRGLGAVHWNAALVAERSHDFRRAQEHLERALELLDEGEVTRDLVRLRLSYVYVLMSTRPVQAYEASAQIDLLAPQAHHIGSADERAMLDVLRSRVALALGDPGRAEQCARTGLERLRGHVRLESASARVALGDALFAQRFDREAAHEYEAAADLLGMMSANRQSARVWQDLGVRLLEIGETERAVDALGRSLSEAGLRSSLPMLAPGRAVLEAGPGRPTVRSEPVR